MLLNIIDIDGDSPPEIAHRCIINSSPHHIERAQANQHRYIYLLETCVQLFSHLNGTHTGIFTE